MQSGRARIASVIFVLSTLLAACANVEGTFGRSPNRNLEITYRDGRYQAVFYDTDRPKGFLPRATVDATKKRDAVTFTIPDGVESAGDYYGHVSIQSFGGTWTHTNANGAPMTEIVHWGRWVIVN